jgi:hypothetical protein
MRTRQHHFISRYTIQNYEYDNEPKLVGRYEIVRALDGQAIPTKRPTIDRLVVV